MLFFLRKNEYPGRKSWFRHANGNPKALGHSSVKLQGCKEKHDLVRHNKRPCEILGNIKRGRIDQCILVQLNETNST